MTPPPNTNSENVAMNTVPEVMSVRLKVWLSAWFITSLKLPRTPSLRSSRMRSKITMVSLIEKPMIVRTAATMVALNSRPDRQYQPIVISTSWITATTAPTANENS